MLLLLLLICKKMNNVSQRAHRTMFKVVFDCFSWVFDPSWSQLSQKMRMLAYRARAPPRSIISTIGILFWVINETTRPFKPKTPWQVARTFFFHTLVPIRSISRDGVVAFSHDGWVLERGTARPACAERPEISPATDCYRRTVFMQPERTYS